MSESKNQKKKFFILTNQKKDPNGEYTKELVDYLHNIGMECTTSEKDPDLRNSGYLYTDADSVPEDTDCIITLGGDGTILQASRDLHSLKIPILGANIGTLGFLADATRETVYDAIDKYVAGDYEIDKRMMICGEVVRNGEKVYENFALNDCVINRSGSLRVIDFDISVNGEFLCSYVADGVIIATATGSTAYSLSAGGPIIQPNAKMLVITPICPHTINKRSIILDPDDEIIVDINDTKNTKDEREITFDGETFFGLQTGDKVYIRRFPESALFIKTSKDSFLQKVRKCLH